MEPNPQREVSTLTSSSPEHWTLWLQARWLSKWAQADAAKLFGTRSLKIFDMCVQVCVKEVAQHCKPRRQLPGVLQVWKSSTMMHCCSRGLLGRAACRDSAAHEWLPPASCHNMQWSILWWLHTDLPLLKPRLFSEVFLMRFLAVCVSPGFLHLYLALPVSVQSCRNMTFAYVSLGEEGQIWKAVQPSNKKIVPSLPLLRRCRRSALVFVCFSSSGSDLTSTMNTSTVLLPARRLPVISSHPGPCWDEEARVFRPYIDPRLISCFAAEARAGAVYNLRLSGCSSTAAVGLQLSSCCFPALPLVWAPALQSVSKIENRLSGLKKMRSRASHL